MNTQTEKTGEIFGRDPDWWRGAVIYQIYPRSYQDSNGDGIGDIAGIVSRLDYIASLGVDAIWLSPFFTSPMQDFGYDVADYRDVDPMFGTLADFDLLVEEAEKRGLRILIDLVLSHTSDLHPWFKESRGSRDNARADWYVWTESKPDGTPPNNWLSVFGGSAWEWDTGRCQYYLHNFLASQPDLNFHNPAVQDAVLDVARFWLQRGVGGFRLDTVNFYFHDKELRDNPAAPPGTEVSTVPKSNPYARQLHLYDKSRPENLKFLERLRAVMDEFPAITSVGELGTDNDVYALTAAYTEEDKRLHMAYSFDLLGPNNTAGHVRSAAAAMNEGIGSGWPSWALSNHDFARVVSRWGHQAEAERFAPLALALVGCLRGSPCIYEGEELGLTEADVPYERLQDPYGKRFWPAFKGRDGCRTPMPWTSQGPNAGFTAGEPWLPVPSDHLARSVAAQDGKPGSVLERARTFINWRKHQTALQKGGMRFLDVPEPLIAFERSHGNESVLVVLNLGAEPASAEIAGLPAATALEGHGFAGARVKDGSLTLPGFGAWFGRME
ncbi:MAG: alpha-glucosidase family protein [Ancalomicrobiaceae bacterium]|nr:alpha-glucosidase family protein [Ancalomicrobiaceae bacterium]